VGLGYFILFASAQIVADWISGNVPFYDYIHIPFIILFGLSIVATWARPKVGYITGVVSGDCWFFGRWDGEPASLISE
jgi:hypothetical protein